VKRYQLFYCVGILAYIFIGIDLNAHGFAQGTLIKSSEDGWWSIEQVCRLSRKHNRQSVASYDFYLGCLVNQRVKAGAESETNCYLRIGFDEYRCHDIVCTPTQEFYMSLSHEWVPAYTLKVGDMLLSQHDISTEITYIEFIKQPIKVYSIEVKNTHNFFVGHYVVLTHNLFLPVALGIGLGGSFGSGAVVGGAAGGFFSPITFAGGIVVGGLIGIAIKVFSHDKQLPRYRLAFDIDVIDGYLKNDNEQRDKNNDAQAPGKPTENDGYFPPKNWDGKKVKNPHGRGFGWPDEKGKIWVPTGPKGHGGPHWDVQDPRSNDKPYRNILPGGKER
jgi:hypothetical protein